jgi:hypothetical protein
MKANPKQNRRRYRHEKGMYLFFDNLFVTAQRLQ